MVFLEFENSELCRKCGGYCCKKSGCDYFVDDFSDLSYKGILNILSTGNVSVVAMLRFSELKNGRLACMPLLYLRARNKDRDIIDLVSIKRKCSMLREDGCSYDIKDRPSGGVNLVPMGDKLKCFYNGDLLSEVLKWEDYQKSLSRVVKRYTGLSVDAKIREDVRNLFSDILNGELEKCATEEKVDVLGMTEQLLRAFPEEVLAINKDRVLQKEK